MPTTDNGAKAALTKAEQKAADIAKFNKLSSDRFSLTTETFVDISTPEGKILIKKELKATRAIGSTKLAALVASNAAEDNKTPKDAKKGPITTIAAQEESLLASVRIEDNILNNFENLLI